jgi:hypothetical protein
LDYLMSYEPVSRVEGVRVPTLIVWGDKDRLRPVLYASMFHDRVKGSTLRIHRRPWPQPPLPWESGQRRDVRAFMRTALTRRHAYGNPDMVSDGLVTRYFEND